MNRIRQLLARRGQRKLLVPFFTAGYPDLNATEDLVRTAVDAGADMVEIGIPFSDPIADGPAIQYSSQVALAGGVTIERIWRLAQRIRSTIDTPLLFMGYINPLLAIGRGRFLYRTYEAGVDGLIIPDLPVEEAAPIQQKIEQFDMTLVFLVAPTSDDERIRMIDRLTRDFTYAVTVTGVTGSRRNFTSATERYLKHLRKTLTKPFVAGFGVSSAETASQMARFADGVVIGSALIERMRQARTRPSGVKAVGRLLKEIRSALDNLG